ncbi:AMP-binding protein [Phytoactinopolyspora limicola]|uniref:AMP-binding protein n=1 Tax=Phytoactinopolyspora limicola TaxID=2715536 RepID=UPI00140DF5B9|nr:AMP-binding protein [Phytoactinopolyspora limicola]
MDIATLVDRAARRFGEHLAVEGPDAAGHWQRLTFAGLGDRVLRLAAGLRRMGLQPGDRVLDLQSNSTTYLETDLAIRAAGLVRVALNYRLHPEDWARIAADCGATTLIYDTRFAGDAAGLASQLDRVLVVGSDSAPGTPLDSLLDAPAPAVGTASDPDDLCGLHYSSGTTGHPKGAQRTHRNWVAGTVNMTHDVLGGPPSATDVYCHAGPITHTSGLFVLPFLVAGARQVILPKWDADQFADAITRYGVTHTALVPTMVSRLLALDDDTLAPARRRLRVLGYAGAPMPPEVIRAAHSRITPNLVQYYGLVEAIPPVTILDAADHATGLDAEPDLLSSAGRPALGVELRVVDESGQPVPDGDIGEVITRGDHVMRGYWNGSGRTDLGKAVVDGWLHTGDLGRLDGSGRLWLVDRVGDMIITGGYNVYPREVEDVVAEVPGVTQVAVVGVTDADWGQRVVALYTADGDVDENTVTTHCRDRLASYKRPKQAIRVTSFPLNSTQKIAKKVLRERLELGEELPRWNA